MQTNEDFAGFPTSDWGVTTYRILDLLAKRWDPTRLTTVAMFPARKGAIGKSDPDFNTKIEPPELATVTDIASFNYRWMNYQDYLKHAPDMIIYQSEATTNELIAPYFGMDPEKMIGLAYWGAIEYWGESHGWPRKGWNYSYFNHALEPFPQAYLIKSIFTETPLVHIGVVDKAAESMEWNEQTVGTTNVSSHWNRETGKQYNLFTYTNADEVELLVNGKTIGVRKNNTDVDKRNMISWQNVPYQKGSITAIARNDGKEVARHTLETTGKGVALRLETENAAWKADGMDLQYVKVYAVDRNGRIVADFPAAPATAAAPATIVPSFTTTGTSTVAAVAATVAAVAAATAATATAVGAWSDQSPQAGEVTFEITGAARLIAVDNGDHSSDELFAGNKRRLHKGFVMAILRSTQTAGTVKIKASAAGLKSVEKTLVTH